MKRLFSILILIALVGHSTKAQSPRVKTAPLAAWLERISFDKKGVPVKGQESSYYYLLIDEQENIAREESYTHFVYKILSNEGVQEMSDLSVDFDPSYEQLFFHAVNIYRNDQKIDQLNRDIRTIQREQSMDRFLYDGSLTAVINLADVRVGDIVEYSYTKKGYNPVYDGYFSSRINFNYTNSYEKAFKRLLIPTSAHLSIKYFNEEIQPVVKRVGDLTDYTWETERVAASFVDNHEPDWYDSYKTVQVSTFPSWAEVARWASKRYHISVEDKQKVARDLVSKFKGQTLEDYTVEVIRFVQDEIRYLGFESGLNSHLPHAPLEVFQQRFGDCKDKSLLLVALLNGKGIEAYPVLVNTSYRAKIVDRLPSIHSFNHCVVELKLNDQVIYIDPTISSQGGELDKIYFPLYGKGLIVKPGTQDLIDFPEPVKSSTAEVQTFDIATMGGEAVLEVETTYRGYEADYQRSYFASNSMEQIQKNYVTYYGNVYPDIEKFEDIETEDDRNANLFKIKESYKIPTFWKPSEGSEGKIFCEFYPLTLESYFNVTKSANRTAPYRLAFPLDYSHEITARLPVEFDIPEEKQTLESEFYEYNFQVTPGKKVFSIFTNYKTKDNHIPVNAFAKFVEDHSKMMTNLNYSLTYDKSFALKTNNKIPGIIVSLLALGLGVALVLWLYHKYDPISHPATRGTPIGGWLILVALGISVTPFRILFDFISKDYFLSGQGWLTYWYNGSYGYFLFAFLEHIYNIVFLMYSALLAILFFQRRSSVPRLAIIFYGTTLWVTIIDSILSIQIDPNTKVDSTEITRALIAAAIWIPYFVKSRRVKETFVVMLNPDSGHQSENQNV